MVDVEDESVSNNRHRCVLKKVASANARSSLMLTSSNINCVGVVGGGAVGNANSRSLPRRCKEPYPIDGVCPDGTLTATPLYGNLRNNKRSVCHEDVPLNGSNSQSGCSSSVSGRYELSVDFQQKQIEILTRKYGGQFRARRAAVIIQKAYRKYSMKKKFEKLRKRSSVATSHSNRLFVSNIEIDTNDINNYKAKVSWDGGGYRIAPPADHLMTPGGSNSQTFNDATREKFRPGNVDDGRVVLPPTLTTSKLNRKVDDNRTDISSSSSPIIAVNTKVSNCRTSSSPVGQQHPTEEQHQSTSLRSHNKQRTVSVERNQYTATTNLNVTPIEIDTFKVATTTANVVGECKLFNNNNNNNSTNILLSTSSAEVSTSNDTQYVSYVQIGCCNRKEDSKIPSQFVDPSSSSYTATLRSGVPTDDELTTPGRATRTRFPSSFSSDDDNKRKAVVDQFYSPIKLQEKSKTHVHQTKSVDSVKDLCTASSTSSSVVSHSAKGRQRQNEKEEEQEDEETFHCSHNHKLSTPLSPMSPIWVPRTNSPIKISVADNLTPIADGHHQMTACRSSNNSNVSRNRTNIPTVESRLLHHWAWGRPALYRASIRRNDIERRRQYRIALNFFNK